MQSIQGLIGKWSWLMVQIQPRAESAATTDYRTTYPTTLDPPAVLK
jgi:hypothetical protein